MKQLRLQKICLCRPGHGLWGLAVCMTLGGSAYAQGAAEGEAAPLAPVTEPAAAQSQADADADRALYEQELASAQRLHDELSQVLTSDGRIATAGQRERAGYTRLAALSTRCEVLANNASYDEAKLILLNCRARVLAALARLEAGAQANEPGPGWLGQLRAVARQVRGLELAAAEPTADYWQLLADLSEASRLSASIGARQSLAEQLLAGYIEAYAEAPAAAEYVADVRLSLAQLLDQRGNQRAAAVQLSLIGELSEDSPRLQEAAELIERVERIGMPVELEAVTTRGTLWRTSDHVGTPVLIHVYADAVEPSVQMITQIQEAIDARALGGCAIVSLRVGEPSARVTPPRWPVVPVELEPGGVLDRLGIDALPTLAWLDHEGKLASIGCTAAVLAEQPITPEPEPAPESEPAPEIAPEPEPAPAPDAEAAPQPDE